MQTTAALRERGRLAALLHRRLQRARRAPGWRGPDVRGLRTWRPRQGRVEEAVLAQALGLPGRAGLAPIGEGCGLLS